jgi:hypothetical protein
VRDLDAVTWLVGHRIESVAHDGLGWNLTLDRRASLQIASVWQALQDGRVCLASGDDQQSYGLGDPICGVSAESKLLAGRYVVQVTLDPASADLSLTLSGGVVFRTFNDSSGYEGWQAVRPDGVMIVAQGGGSIRQVQAPPG